MSGSKNLLDELRGKPAALAPVSLERYNIKAWKDKALLGLSGEDHTDFYDITQFIDANAYQGAYGSAMPSELKMSSKKVVDDPGFGLNKVSPTMWFGANAKIQGKLLNEGKLNGDMMYGYIAYTLKISELTIEHTWQSVLKFDRQFRIQQALTKCGWGEDFPHLNSTWLVKKPPSWHTTKFQR